MKTGILIIVLFVFPFAHLFGKLRNGYDGKLQRTKETLQKLRMQLFEDITLTSEQRRKVKTEIKELINYISCHQLTDELLIQFRLLSPDLFREMDSIVDKRQRVTDIYVKVIPKEGAVIKLEGTSSFTHSLIDDDASCSEFGDYSVSVNIWISPNSLLLLYHELGHVSHVVPNLAEYYTFYKRYYPIPLATIISIGHHRKDQSGKAALAFERRFFNDRSVYARLNGQKVRTATAAMQKIRKGNRGLETMLIQDQWATRHAVEY